MPASSPTSLTAKRHPIDNLQIGRGLSALMVLTYHANQEIDPRLFGGIFLAGWCGVDFFFVLSGFIIYYTNHRLFYQPRQAVSFLRHRFLRVFPVYWFYLLFALLPQFLLVILIGRGYINWMTLDGVSLVKALFLYPVDSQLTRVQWPILTVSWTLSHEILFYLLFGVCIVLPRPKYVLALLGIWVLFIVSLFWAGPYPYPVFIKLLANSRNLEFLYGCLLARFVLVTPDLRKGFSALALGLVLFFIAWYSVINDHSIFQNRECIFFGIPFAILIYAAVKLEFPGHKGALIRTLVFLGNASYSLYLVHTPVIKILSRLVSHSPVSPALVFVVSCSLSLLIGCAGYWYVERPLLAYLMPKKSLPPSSVNHPIPT